MKKLIFFLIILILLCVSCDISPTITYPLTLRVVGRDSDIYWQMEDNSEYTHYPTKDIIYTDIEPEYTLRFIRVVMKEGVMTITDTYEMHIVIDHYITTIIATYDKDNGLGCIVEQSWKLED